MKEFSLYNERGQVADPEIARAMAEAENPYREKRKVGPFKLAPKSKDIAVGKEIAEKVGRGLISAKIDKVVAEQKEKQAEEKKLLGSIRHYHIHGSISSTNRAEALGVYSFEIYTDEHEISFLNFTFSHLDPRKIDEYPKKCIMDGKEATIEQCRELWDKYKEFVTIKSYERFRSIRSREFEYHEKDNSSK